MATIAINGVTISGSSVSVPASFPATVTWSGNSGYGIFFMLVDGDINYTVTITQTGTTYGPWASFFIETSKESWNPGGTSGTLTLSNPTPSVLGQRGLVRDTTTGTETYVNWVTPTTRCTTPTSASLAATTSTGGNVTLSWSGAADGTGNAVNRYRLQRAESSDGSSWGSFADFTDNTVSGTAPSGSKAVAPPSTLGHYYKFRVRAEGTAGQSYYPNNPEWRESSNTLKRTTTACTAPSLSLDVTTSTGDNATLSWSGAAGSTLNAITGYQIQRREYAQQTWGAWADFQSISSSASSGTLSVAPPSTAFNKYEYRIRTLGAGGSDYYSSWATSSNTRERLPTVCGAPTDVALDDTYAVSGQVTLRWAPGTAGSLNTITGYGIERSESSDGGSTWGDWTALATASALFYDVDVPTTVGHKYRFRVQTQGSAGSSYYSGFTVSSNTIEKASQDCQAPTALTASPAQSTGDPATLTWSGAADGYQNPVTGYTVERSTDQTNWTVIEAVASPNTTSVSVTPPANVGDIYYYRVRSVGQVTDSPGYSPVASVTRVVTISTPVLSVTPSTGPSGHVTWTEAVISGGTGTVVYSLKCDGVEILSTTSREFTTSAEYSAPVTFTVQASCASLGLTSDLSNAVTFTYDASLTGASNVAVNPATGTSTTVSWDPGSTSDQSPVTYDLLADGTAIKSGLSVTHVDLTEEECVGYTAGVTFTVRTHGSGKTAISEGVTFTYVMAPIVTPNLGLTKPRSSEYMLVGPLNGNMDILDEHVSAIDRQLRIWEAVPPTVDPESVEETVEDYLVELTAAETATLLAGKDFWED